MYVLAFIFVQDSRSFENELWIVALFFRRSIWLLTYAQKVFVSDEITGARIAKTALEEAARIVKKDDRQMLDRDSIYV